MTTCQFVFFVTVCVLWLEIVTVLAKLKLLNHNNRFYFHVNGHDVPVDIDVGPEIIKLQEKFLFPDYVEAEQSARNVRSTSDNINYMPDAVARNPGIESQYEYYQDVDYESGPDYNEIQESAESPASLTRSDIIRRFVEDAFRNSSEVQRVQLIIDAIAEDVENSYE